MGRTFSSPREEERYYAELHARQQAERVARKEAGEARRMELAAKIAMVVIDKVNRDIIRPGPDAEERECYDMSQELRDISPDLQAIIAQVLGVESAATNPKDRP